MPIVLELVADFGPVLVTAMVALLAFAVGVLGYAMGRLLGNLPIVGGQVAAAVSGAVVGVSHWALGWLEGGAGALVQLVSAPVQALAGLLAQLVVHAETLTQYVLDLAATLVADVGSLASRISRLESTFLPRTAAILAAAAAVPGLLALTAWLRDVGLARAQAAAAAAAAADAARRVAAAEATAAAATAATARQAALALDAERTARADADAATRAAAAASAAAVSTALASAEQALRTTIGADVADLTREIGQAQTAATAAALAVALPAVQAIEQEFEATRRTCIDPLCSGLGMQLGLIEGLTDAAFLALLFGLFHEAVTDPDAAARTVADLGGVLRPLVSGVTQELAGVGL